MFVKEIGGLNPDRKPKASTFENNYKYGEMLVEKTSIILHLRTPFTTYNRKSACGIHFKWKVIGLSKNELLSIIRDLKYKNDSAPANCAGVTALGTQDVACVIDAKHLCVNSRGISDIESSTVTSEFGGKFKEPQARRIFRYIKLDTKFGLNNLLI
jgi:GTP cyclohydrolase I